jgi:hypothetical protein
MLAKKNKKVISVQTIEHDDLIKMIENMDGVSVKRTANGVQIYVRKQVLSNSSVGFCIKGKNKREKRIEHLTPIYGVEKKKKDAVEFRQSSAIIAKSY